MSYQKYWIVMNKWDEAGLADPEHISLTENGAIKYAISQGSGKLYKTPENVTWYQNSPEYPSTEPIKLDQLIRQIKEKHVFFPGDYTGRARNSQSFLYIREISVKPDPELNINQN